MTAPLNLTITLSDFQREGRLFQLKSKYQKTLIQSTWFKRLIIIKTIPTHEAKTHLSRYLKAVSAGETIIIARGQCPLAKLVPIAHHPTPRPKVGQVPDERITVPHDALLARSPNELVAWGL